MVSETTNLLFAGIIAGIGEYFDMDPTILRLAYILIAILTGLVPAIVAYIIAVLIVPKKPQVYHMPASEYAEKPKTPKSDLALTGLSLFDNTVFEKMRNQKPSARGELEWTYVLNKYIRENKLKAHILQKPWFDVGTFDNLLDASVYMRNKQKRAKV